MKTKNFIQNKLVHVLSVICLTLLVSCSNNDDGGIDKSTRPDLYTFVPDDNFERLIINQGYDDVLDNYITNANVENVTQLLFTSGYESWVFNSSGIRDFRGIEAFVSLESFDCSSLGLTDIDLSQNTALKSLNCSDNNFTTLNLSNLTQLESLNCSYNNLSSLQIESTQMRYLACHENNLYALDISMANNLENLVCFGNNLSQLELTGKENLERLQASSNAFETLDISTNIGLIYMECHNNLALTCIKVNEDQLTLNWNFCSSELFSLDCN